MCCSHLGRMVLMPCQCCLHHLTFLVSYRSFRLNKTHVFICLRGIQIHKSPVSSNMVCCQITKNYRLFFQLHDSAPRMCLLAIFITRMNTLVLYTINIHKPWKLASAISQLNAIFGALPPSCDLGFHSIGDFPARSRTA